MLAEVVPDCAHPLRVFDEDEGDDRLCSGGGGEYVGRHNGGSGQVTSGLRGFLEVAHVASVGVIDDAETERSIPPLSLLGSVPSGPSPRPLACT